MEIDKCPVKINGVPCSLELTQKPTEDKSEIATHLDVYECPLGHRSYFVPTKETDSQLAASFRSDAGPQFSMNQSGDNSKGRLCFFRCWKCKLVFNFKLAATEQLLVMARLIECPSCGHRPKFPKADDVFTATEVHKVLGRLKIGRNK